MSKQRKQLRQNVDNIKARISDMDAEALQILYQQMYPAGSGPLGLMVWVAAFVELEAERRGITLFSV